MRKIQIYNIVFAIIIFLYVLCFILNICGVSQFAFIEEYWFPIFLVMMGILVLMRGILFYSDSSMFSGIALILVGVAFVIKQVFELKFYYALPAMLVGITISLFITYIMFKNKLYLKAFCISIVITAISCVGYVF